MTDTSLIFESGAASDVGKVRKVNEDSFLVRAGSGLWCVSDGMGGHEAGRLASTMIVEALSTVEPQEAAAGLLSECDRRLSVVNHRLRRIASDRNYEVVGATVVVLLIHGHSYACLWSGDSRIYRVRGGALTQLTRDHSEAEELVQRGIMTREEVKHWPRRNVITRAIGVADLPEVEIVNGSVEPGDSYVLCSDGLTNHVADPEIASIVAEFDVQTACDRLVALTLERGAKDNVTVVVARAQRREPTLIDPGGAAKANWDVGA
ncbi:serine/threonine-protein phosphatase [Siculibacillus lacustris]|uniref:Serine/threonine-protein phosphatase n=1 Tax=Siculibacillus lacustris TaxID=1549641 RepID=A0A4Q9VM31_9HYPH|nr:protein phosphatase 2C domain-containing protein [Siculibacillus lacustris]TBW36591.1 serine/threonine-protein phosphatase [Siculibacillus lacustris]